MTNELLGYVTQAVAALLSLAVLFGVDLTEDQIAGILAALAAVGTLAFAINTRTGKVKQIREAAKREGVL